LHISTLDPFKNPLLILHAFAIVIKSRPDVTLTIVGPEKPEIMEWIKENKMDQYIIFKQEMPQVELAALMRAHDALVLYSKYETFGCVVIEANACGKPVIVSDIPVFHETVHEGVNGFFAPQNNSNDLALVIQEFISANTQLNAQNISEITAAKYSYTTVGKKFSEWYTGILAK